MIKCIELKKFRNVLIPLGFNQYAVILKRVKSPYQTIDVAKMPNGELALFLDGELQFTEGRMLYSYHNAHLKALKYLKNSPKNIAIIGGGDLILAGMLKDWYPDASIYVLELDPCVVKVSTELPIHIHRNAHKAKNVKILYGDAFKTIERFPDGYFDVIFVDLPDAITVEKDRLLYSKDRLSKLGKKVKVGGIMSVYGGGLYDDEFIRRIPYGFVLLSRNNAEGYLMDSIGYVYTLMRLA